MNRKMKKCIVLLLGVFLTIGLFAQNCEQLEKENVALKNIIEQNKNEISSLRNQNQVLEKENIYLKEALNLRTSNKETNIQDFVFKINKVEGSSADGKIIIEGLVENIGEVSSMRVASVEIIDPKGNQYKTYTIDVGNTGGAIVDKFQRQIPLKFKIEVDKIVDEMPILAAIVIRTRDRNSFYEKTGVLKNVKVDWK